MRPPAALARAQRETNDARQRVAVLARARPQSHDATPSVAAALRQKLQRLQTSYATKAEDIASRAPRRPAENVIRILERHERSYLKCAARSTKSRRACFKKEPSRRKPRSGRRATRSSPSSASAFYAGPGARFNERRPGGPGGTSRTGKDERFAEIACDTRRAFAFFAAMRPRLARRKLGKPRFWHLRAPPRPVVLPPLRRAQARRGKIVREISRSANRRHARRA